MSESKSRAVISSAASSQGLVLAEVNLIMPTETFGAVLGEFDKVSIETVKVNTADVREVYEPNGKGKGFALGKSALQKIASALSIQWDPRYTGSVESTATRSRAKAVGGMRKPNGETIVIAEEKTIDLDVERETERAKVEKNAQDGKVVRWDGNRPVKEPWGSEAEKTRWIELEIENAIKQKRRFKDELALTGAKDRVIRAFLALKSTYTAEELAKPLAFPRVTTDTGKLLADPRTRATAIGMIGQATAGLFGPGPDPEPAAIAAPAQAPERQVGPEAEASTEPPDDFGAAFAAAPAGEPSEIEKLTQAFVEWAQSDNVIISKRAQKVVDAGITDLRVLRAALEIIKYLGNGGTVGVDTSTWTLDNKLGDVAALETVVGKIRKLTAAARSA